MKKHLIFILSSALLSFLLSCKSEPAPSSASSSLPKIVDTIANRKSKPLALAIPTSHDCAVRGKLMDDNELLDSERTALGLHCGG